MFYGFLVSARRSDTDVDQEKHLPCVSKYSARTLRRVHNFVFPPWIYVFQLFLSFRLSHRTSRHHNKIDNIMHHDHRVLFPVNHIFFCTHEMPAFVLVTINNNNLEHNIFVMRGLPYSIASRSGRPPSTNLRSVAEPGRRQFDRPSSSHRPIVVSRVPLRSTVVQ